MSDFSEDDFDDSTIQKKVQAANRKKQKSGGFQAMGLVPTLFKAIQHMGYSFPTPIQRKAIPVVMEGRDVVAMARTGSGKTAAFLIPMVNRLKCHSAIVGARAIVLSPSRELAMQTLKFTKDLCKHNDLRACALVGGDSMEEQFKMMASNPDIIIATPGRLMHLCIEMNLNFSTVEYIVFDEADRLFELGFAEQLHEILHKVPEKRQTLLFSATLPRLLVDFAKAGLTEPALIRLDADSKISKDLELLFFSLKTQEKDSALMFCLESLIPKESSVIIFTATKHHVDYLYQMLTLASVNCTFIYGSLDQQARKINLARFRNGKCQVLIVTDVAARGIDIPLLDFVINYDFPSQPKVFVHRVGRVARAGRKGTAISFVLPEEMPYLLDFQLFSGKPLLICNKMNQQNPEYQTSVCLGGFPTGLLDLGCEQVTKWLQTDLTLETYYKATQNAKKLYIRTKSSASAESHKRSKQIQVAAIGTHPKLQEFSNTTREQEDLVFKIANYRPQETIFEVGKRGSNIEAQVVKKRRILVEKSEKPRDEFYMSHTKSDAFDDKAYALKTKPENFVEQAKYAELELMGDEKKKPIWDSKKHKFVNRTIGADNKKMIRTESGRLIPASYKTEKFAQWQKRSKIEIPRVGEAELANGAYKASKFKHNKTFARKPFSLKSQKPISTVKSELKTANEISKQRKIKMNRMKKNARPSKK